MMLVSGALLGIAALLCLTTGLAFMTYAAGLMKFLITTKEDPTVLLYLLSGALGSVSILLLIGGLKFALMLIW
jgi:hypothetical protein